MLKSKKLFSRFDGACFQVVNTKKGHSSNFQFRFVGYSTIFTAPRRAFDVQLESLRMQQMEETFRKLYNTDMLMVAMICLCTERRILKMYILRNSKIWVSFRVEVQINDNPSSFEGAHMAFKKIRKLEIGHRTRRALLLDLH